MAKKASTVRLKPGASIGEPTAEDDHVFLNECFVDNSTVEVLKDLSSPRSLLLGRTGSGKSAVLWYLQAYLDNVSRIDPKDVAFQHVGNSAIVQHLTEIGVGLHTFFEYLWTHILTLHITRECLSAHTNDGLRGIALMIKNNLGQRNRHRDIAANYLEKHAHTFFLNVEEVSTEFTNKATEKLAAEVNLDVKAFKSKLESGHEWSDENKKLFKHRGTEVVSTVQMQALKETINALAECIDTKKSHYILIDDLDLEWAGGSEIQYALIRALIESLKTLRRIPNVKIIVAMREDLYDATVRTTTDKHFQKERYTGIIERLKWNDGELIRIVERRIDRLFRYAYTKQSVMLTDVFPDKIGTMALRSYLVEHTLRRPRDIIAFVNKVLSENEGEPLPLSARPITRAEPNYSSDRLRALEDEWRACHPLIPTYLRSLQDLTIPAVLADLDEERLFYLVVEVSDLGRKPIDDIERLAKTVYETNKELRFKKLARSLVSSLYKVGAVGVKLRATEAYSFSYGQRMLLDDQEIPDDARLIVHPMLMSCLACHTAKKTRHKAA